MENNEAASLSFSIWVSVCVFADWCRLMSEERKGQTPLVESLMSCETQPKLAHWFRETWGSIISLNTPLWSSPEGISSELRCCHHHLQENHLSYLPRQPCGASIRIYLEVKWVTLHSETVPNTVNCRDI